MNAYDEALWEVHSVYSKMGVSYAIIGGAAVQYWGEPRFKQDIDLTVAAPLEDLIGFVNQIIEQLTSRLEYAQEFALQSRVILVETQQGFPLDIALGLPGYEDEVFRRVFPIELEHDKQINICSAEDLIIHKAVAGRAQDIRDIESIIHRQGTTLDIS